MSVNLQNIKETYEDGTVYIGSFLRLIFKVKNFMACDMGREKWYTFLFEWDFYLK